MPRTKAGYVTESFTEGGAFAAARCELEELEQQQINWYDLQIQVSATGLGTGRSLCCGSGSGNTVAPGGC